MSTKEILELLRAKFKDNKVDIHNFIQSLGFKDWKDLEKADPSDKIELLRKLKSEREYIVIETDTHIISRPKDIKKVSEISFSIKGWSPNRK
jgi:hypothetical protein